MSAAIIAQTERDDLAASARNKEMAMLGAVARKATTRFAMQRKIIRVLSVVVALAPLVVGTIAWLTGHLGWLGLLLCSLTCLLGAAAAMDRPGAWLSKVIQGRIDHWAEGLLRDFDRHDIASELIINWNNGIATASAAAFEVER